MCFFPQKVIKILFTYLFLERGEGREKKGERSIDVWLPLPMSPTRDLACNPGMCPDWELNWHPLVRMPALNPLSHTSQGPLLLF